jgi:hypothetical protein
MARRHTVVNPDAVERYIRGGVMPRFMHRLRDIDAELHLHATRLERRHAELREECGRDAAEFARRWRELARGWNFERVNALIEQHNEYYPIERNLPVDSRTGEYLTVSGRPYLREPAGAEWILRRFPAELSL